MFRLSPRWSKVIGDLRGNKTRTLLVVLSIAVGVFAVGAIASSRIILNRDLAAEYAAVNPADIDIGCEEFDQDLVETVRGMKEVQYAEGRRNVSVRLRLGADRWRTLELSAIPDFKDIKINKIVSEQGAWPPGKGEVLIERASLGLTEAKVGDKVLVKTPEGKERTLRIAGLVHDVNLPPAVFVGRAYGYITYDTVEQLGYSREFDMMQARVAASAPTREMVQKIANKVQDKIEASGRSTYYVWVPTPGEHPANDSIQPMLMVLGVLGSLALLLSGFLVVNTIGAIMTQQVRHIGIMKAIGARNRQIMGMYFGLVLSFGILALAVAVPLGAVGARLFAGYMAKLINFDVANYSIPVPVLALELVVGLLVPLLAALAPVINGIRIPVREAVSDYGLGGQKGYGQSRLDRLLGKVRVLPRPLLLSLRNTFRRKGRLALTLFTLTLGGAIFIGVFSVKASLMRTLDDALEYWKYDLQVEFNDPQRVELVEAEALKVPGVVKAECWGGLGVRRLRPDDSESEGYSLIAPPANTQLLKPTLVKGRWLLPEDENALVINTNISTEEPDLKIGSEVIFKIKGKETKWVVVGLVRGVMTGPIAYANYPYFAQVAGNFGQAGGVQIVTDRHTGDYQAQVAKNLEQHFKQQGLKVSSTETTTDLRKRIELQFNILVVFLVIMAVLLAIVGGLGLMGTMSINVLERTREIGVMRAIGASDGAILQIFLVEGILIGLLSWVFGATLALPLSKGLSDAVGNGFLKSPLTFTFSVSGAFMWLGLVAVLAGIASFLPARRASRLSVREVLAYE